MSVTDTATRLLAEELGLSSDRIGPDTGLHNTPEWNSLAHLRIVLALEEALGQPLGPEDVVSLSGFPDVVALLERG